MRCADASLLAQGMSVHVCVWKRYEFVGKCQDAGTLNAWLK